MSGGQAPGGGPSAEGRRPAFPETAAWVRRLGLVPHPEGGWYAETHRSARAWPAEALGPAFGGPRAAITSIHYLLERGDFSTFHRLAAEELWYHQGGADLLLHELRPDGTHGTRRLGGRPSGEGLPQLAVPPGTWFAAEPDPDDPLPWVLCGCAVAPGFDFADFAMGEREALRAGWPSAEGLILRLTRG